MKLYILTKEEVLLNTITGQRVNARAFIYDEPTQLVFTISHKDVVDTYNAGSICYILQKTGECIDIEEAQPLGQSFEVESLAFLGMLEDEMATLDEIIENYL